MSNLSGSLTTLEDLWNGASGVGHVHLNCGVLAGASEARVVCRLRMEVLVVHHWGCFG